MKTTTKPKPRITDKQPTQLQGFRAAAKNVGMALDDAENLKPLRFKLRRGNLSAYRQGRYEGLLFAHCQHAMGEFPWHNVAAIHAALKGGAK